MNWKKVPSNSSEREEAYEMAKQVAHEIKNPLTPMRLTVQSFQRKFDPTDPNVKQNERLLRDAYSTN
jgi:nitrogen fixation/metabolism regulation signal transduction histidine kinase